MFTLGLKELAFFLTSLLLGKILLGQPFLKSHAFELPEGSSKIVKEYTSPIGDQLARLQRKM